MQKRKIIDIIVITAFIIIHALICYYGRTPDILGGLVRLLVEGNPWELYVVFSYPAYALGNLVGNLIIIGIFILVWLKVSKRVFREK